MEQNRIAPTRSVRRRIVQVVFFTLAISLAFSVSAIATAQSTTIYQFGCWGVMSAGGGRTEVDLSGSSNDLYGSMGAWSAGLSANDDYMISSGQISPMAYGVTAASGASTDSDGPPSLYLPFVGNFVEVVYVCPY